MRAPNGHAGPMETSYLPDLADELLSIARKATSGRAARSTRSGRALAAVSPVTKMGVPALSLPEGLR